MVSGDVDEACPEPSNLHPAVASRARRDLGVNLLPVTEPRARRNPGRIRDILRGLSDIFPGHDADQEEPGGSFDQLRMQRRRCKSRLKSLQEGHRSVLEAVSGLQARARHPGGDVTRVGDEIGSSVRRLRARDRHEDPLALDVQLEGEGRSG
jgi:hypothetical protein